MSNTKYDPLSDPKTGVPQKWSKMSLGPISWPPLSKSIDMVPCLIQKVVQKWVQKYHYILHFRTPFSPYFHIPPNTPKIHSTPLCLVPKYDPLFDPQKGYPKSGPKCHFGPISWPPFYTVIIRQHHGISYRRYSKKVVQKWSPYSILGPLFTLFSHTSKYPQNTFPRPYV